MPGFSRPYPGAGYNASNFVVPPAKHGMFDIVVPVTPFLRCTVVAKVALDRCDTVVPRIRRTQAITALGHVLLEAVLHPVRHTPSPPPHVFFVVFFRRGKRGESASA